MLSHGFKDTGDKTEGSSSFQKKKIREEKKKRKSVKAYIKEKKLRCQGRFEEEKGKRGRIGW